MISRENQKLNLDEIIEEYGNSIYRTCYLYLKDVHLAQDALQDTFIKAFNNYDKLRGNHSLKAWVFKIAINVCRDYLRKSARIIVDNEQSFRETFVYDESDINKDNTLSLEIMKLKPKYKEIIILYYYQELKLKEIARILKIPDGTAANRLKRARESLKVSLKGWYENEQFN